MRERFEQRLFRIFAQAGYSPVQLLTITPEEMVEIPGITVPNIRAVLCVQNKVLADRNKIRSGRLVEELLKEAASQAAAMKAKAESDIAQEKRKAVNEIKDEIGGMAMEIAGKVIEREISEEDHAKLIDDFIANVGETS